MRAKPNKKSLTLADIDPNAIPFKQLQLHEIKSIISHFEFENIAETSFDDLNAICNVEKKCLYFPMQDLNGNIVGYKKLMKSDGEKICEETVPESNCFGVVIAGQRRQKDQIKQNAVVVLNICDALAIRSQRINGKTETVEIYDVILHLILSFYNDF